MDIPKSEIYNTVVNIINDTEKLTKIELEEKYKDFKNNFFKLFETCISVTPETKNKILKELSILLSIREEQKSGSKSTIEANVQVTEYMAKQYVYPYTGEPTLEQKKEALRKIVKNEATKNSK
jgi:hypothetical protein